MVIPIPSRGSRAVNPSREAQQFQTHLQLLADTSARVRASLDAIIVPASRPAFNLDHAIMLARKLSCQLVVLCSLKARADEVNDLLASRNFTEAIIVDLPKGYILPKLDLATSKRTSLELPDLCVHPNGDLSAKRNIGLLLARMMGWQRIFFLDDDIRDLYSSDLREVAMMLGPCDAVGMRATDFPDNSVVCHGHRKTGGYQDIFVSGSVLAVHCTDTVAFFPEIYNEDWFFFYLAAAARRLGQYGRDATQLFYDPFADPQRAVGQEFGDVMAEGLYGLLHHRIGMDQAGGDYWQIFLDSRKRFLEAVLARVDTVEPFLRQRIVSSIEAAMKWTWQIKPSMCEHYIKLWKQDLGTWEERLKETPRGLSAKAALSELDLTLSAPSLYVLSGIIGRSAGGGSKRVAANEGSASLSLMPDTTERIKSIAAPVEDDVIASSGAAPFSVRELLREAQTSDGLARGVIGRMSRRAGELVRWAIVAEERPESVDISWSRDSNKSATGRHRRVPEFPPMISTNSADAGAAERPLLAETSPPSGLADRRLCYLCLAHYAEIPAVVSAFAASRLQPT